MSDYRRILVTSALPYANGPIHLGHLAGAYLPADVFCRYHRLRGSDVLFIGGSDEHGVPIMLRAREEGRPAQEVVDRYHAMAARAFEAFGMSFDHYGRTSADVHRTTSQAFFRKLAKDDCFEIKTDQQLYDREAGLFLADRFVVGTCPNCGYDSAYGDQCEKCGISLSPQDLINPRSAITQATPELRQTTHWYLPLGRLQPRLEAWLATKEHWKPNVLGQVKSWLRSGLGDRAMTRDIPWGVPVPDDVAQGAEVDASGKVLYVWFDAPIGYISSTREYAEACGDSDLWRRYWCSEDTRLVHFIGKDNIVFHTLIFPALLQLHGGYVLPENVPANEFLNLEGQKLSTSRGWAVWAQEAVDRFGPDYIRYALLRVLPESKDADFSWKDFQSHINNELADNLGNFLNRTLQFAVKHCGGVVPPLEQPQQGDRDVLAEMARKPEAIGRLIDQHRLREAVQELMSLSRLGNKYFNDSAPWATRKTDPARCNTTIHVALQLCASLSVLMEPFLPFTAARARQMLSLTGVRDSGPRGHDDAKHRASWRASGTRSGNIASGNIGWEDAGRPLLTAGRALGTPDILVRKVEDDVVEAEKSRLERTVQGASEHEASEDGRPYEALAECIDFEDFAKLDLRVGRIDVAERVKKSKKLIRCEVDLGLERRQVLAGVAEHMAPEDLLGLSVVVVANLKPRKMLGLESAGMLLMAKDRDGRLRPVTSTSEPGSTVA